MQIARKLAQSLLANMAAQGMDIRPQGNQSKAGKKKQQERQEFAEFKV